MHVIFTFGTNPHPVMFTIPGLRSSATFFGIKLLVAYLLMRVYVVVGKNDLENWNFCGVIKSFFSVENWYYQDLKRFSDRSTWCNIFTVTLCWSLKYFVFMKTFFLCIQLQLFMLPFVLSDLDYLTYKWLRILVKRFIIILSIVVTLILISIYLCKTLN